MARAIFHLTVVFSAAALSACSLSMDSVWPSLRGDSSSISAPPSRAAIPIAPAKGKKTNPPLSSAAAPPVLGKTSFIPPTVTPGKFTGTFVGQKVKFGKFIGIISKLNRTKAVVSTATDGKWNVPMTRMEAI